MKDYFNTRESRMESRGCYEGDRAEYQKDSMLRVRTGFEPIFTFVWPHASE